MKITPRIFVGTLACGEAEFESCCAAIAAQTGVQITHHVIKDQPEYEAHNMLWRAWSDNKSSHDLFVKIDADTVLNRKTALSELSKFFENPRVTGVQVELNDYFTNDLIVGPLTGFSKQVEFRNAKSKLFVDHADFGHDLILKGKQLENLPVIGWHGKDPSSRQSFHFGFHRKLKGQKDVLRKTAVAWLVQRDEARGWALAGASCAKWWMIGKTHYRSSSFEKHFSLMEQDHERHDAVLSFIKKNYGDLV